MGAPVYTSFMIVVYDSITNKKGLTNYDGSISGPLVMLALFVPIMLSEMFFNPQKFHLVRTYSYRDKLWAITTITIIDSTTDISKTKSAS